MNTIGEMLRYERLKSGLALDRIAQQTKIPVRLLHAIEQGQFDKLPARLFTINFVRQYAHELGLDEEQVIAQLRVEQEPPPPAEIPRTPKRQPVSAATLAGIAAGALVILLVSIAYEGRRNNRTHPPAVTQSAEGTADRAALSERPLPETVPAKPESTNASNSLHLVLKAQASTWVAMKADGRNVFAGMLRPNESKVLENATAVNLVIGNAGAVEISLNGKPIGPIGPSGQTRDVQVTSSGSVQILAHRQALQDIF